MGEERSTICCGSPPFVSHYTRRLNLFGDLNAYPVDTRCFVADA